MRQNENIKNAEMRYLRKNKSAERPGCPLHPCLHDTIPVILTVSPYLCRGISSTRDLKLTLK